jgi:tRNA-dihydrouridine synthase
MMASTGCDGVIVGRGCLGRPWLFRDLADVMAGRTPLPPPPLGVVASIMVAHAQLLADKFGEDIGVSLFRKHASWYLKGFPVGPLLRDGLARVASLDELVVLTEKLDPDIPYPEGADRMVRGHSAGPRPVRLPHGFLEYRGGLHVGLAAEEVISGG